MTNLCNLPDNLSQGGRGGKKRENDRSPTCLPHLSLFSSCGGKKKKTPTKENGGRKRGSFSSLVRAKKCERWERSIAVIIRHRARWNKTFSYRQRSLRSDNGTLLRQRHISLSGFQTFFLFAKMTADPAPLPNLSDVVPGSIRSGLNQGEKCPWSGQKCVDAQQSWFNERFLTQSHCRRPFPSLVQLENNHNFINTSCFKCLDKSLPGERKHPHWQNQYRSLFHSQTHRLNRK